MKMQRCMTLFSPQGPCSLEGRYTKKTNIMNNVVGAGGNKMLGSVNVRDWAQGS